MNARKYYVDYLKTLAIFIVVLGHINCANAAIKGWIYAFHMPLFFMSTGLVLKNEYGQILNREYLLKKISRLYVPYLIWGLIYADFSLKNVLYIFYGSYKTIKLTDTLSSLWYIPCLLLAELLCTYLIKWSDSKHILLFAYVPVLFAIGYFIPNVGKYNYPWSLNIAFVAAAFILLGKVWDIFLRDLFQKHIYIPLLCMILGFGLTLSYKANMATQKDKIVLMASGRYGNYFLFIVGALGGCLLFLSLSVLLEKLIKSATINKAVVYISSNTLCIYFIHKELIKVFKSLTTSVSSNPIRLVLIFIPTVLLSLLASFIINGLAPELVGHKRR